MNNKKRQIAVSWCFFVAAVLLIVYGAEFSWRTVIFTAVALVLWSIGNYFWKTAFAPRPFLRFQFRIGLLIGEALHEAGLYGNELEEATAFISQEMTGRTWITFTWLEPELFFINTTNRYSSTLEINIDLPAFGERVKKRTFELSDLIEMRTTTEGYELVLLTREMLYSVHGSTRGEGLVLFCLPYKFFWSLQKGYEGFDQAKKLLTAAGLTDWQDNEASDAWEYRNRYGTFRWWDV